MGARLRMAVAALVLAAGCGTGPGPAPIPTTQPGPDASTTEAPTTLGPPAPTGPRATITTEYVGPGSVGGAFPAVTQLGHPRIAEPDPARTAYVRDQWDGKGWSDDDGDGCNTRAEVLEAESMARVERKTTNCTVLSGAWVDPYTGKIFALAADVQIDHLVALSDASASGGWAWSPARKAAFANDLDDAWQLNAVDGPENQRKADYGPDRWTPPRAEFRCTYVAAYSGIKERWGLTVTPAQWAAIEKTWASC